ncbi:hypothetical protein D770_08980 [Flammeovirgaceae bacterium 311]|nr:hypothetical protein D770_08980 [Flammeovirgaceae bacterium 311]
MQEASFSYFQQRQLPGCLLYTTDAGNKMKQSLLRILLVSFLAYSNAGDALACKCQGTSTVHGSVRSADIVFSGEVLSSTITYNYDSLGVEITGDTTDMKFQWRGIPTAVVIIKVDKIYKGKSSSDIITILTSTRGASCGVLFNIGSIYIVYATVTDELPFTDKLKRRTFDCKTFWTHQCTRTQEWNKEEVVELKKIR